MTNNLHLTRHNISPRPDWKKRIEKTGLVFWPTGQKNPDGTLDCYWRDDAYYALPSQVVEELYYPQACQLFQMCVDVGEELLRRQGKQWLHWDRLVNRYRIPEWALGPIKQHWDIEPAFGSVYARMDVGIGGPHLKLLEFNADTPTSLLESGVTQWQWLLDQAKAGALPTNARDQWNSLHEDLVAAWKRNMAEIAKRLGHTPVVWFLYTASEESGEDYFTTMCMANICQQAGFEVRVHPLEGTNQEGTDSVHYQDDRNLFYVPDTRTPGEGWPVEVAFCLWPWEWMVHEPFGKPAILGMMRPGGTVWIEPPYKMLWSNKALLVELWRMFGDDPERSKLLLPAYYEDEAPSSWLQPGSGISHVCKPLLGREGANVTVVLNGGPAEETSGMYGEEGFILQQYYDLPVFYHGPAEQPVRPIGGLWFADGEPAGLYFRESSGRITNNASYGVPHVITGSGRDITRYAR